MMNLMRSFVEPYVKKMLLRKEKKFKKIRKQVTCKLEVHKKKGWTVRQWLLTYEIEFHER